MQLILPPVKKAKPLLLSNLDFLPVRQCYSLLARCFARALEAEKADFVTLCKASNRWHDLFRFQKELSISPKGIVYQCPQTQGKFPGYSHNCLL